MQWAKKVKNTEASFKNPKEANSPASKILPKSQFNLITPWGLNGCLIHLLKNDPNVSNWTISIDTTSITSEIGTTPASPQGTRDRIIYAAGPIFAEKGFEAATVREICLAADVNVASINYHFGDKQKLYHETVLYAHSCRHDAVAQPTTPSPEPTVRLQNLIEQILFSMVVNQDGPWQVRLLTNEIQTPTETCRQLVRDHFRPFVLELTQAITDVADKPVADQVLSTLAMSIIGQCMIYRFAPETHVMTMAPEGVSDSGQTPEPVDLTKLADIIVKFSIAGIQAATA